MYRISTKFMLAVSALIMAVMPVLAQEDMANEQQRGAFDPAFLFMMVGVIAIFYLFILRPDKKRQQELQRKLSQLKKGDKVVTVSGIVGVIAAVKDTTYLIKSGDGDDAAVIEFNKSAIQNILTGDGAADNGQVKEAPSAGKGSK